MTVAKELAAKSDARIIHNHTINDPILQVVRKSGAEKIPEAAWKETDKIRKIVFDAIANLAEAQDNFILTNVLVNDKGDQKLFDMVEDVAKRREATFIPISLICEKETLIERVQLPDRTKTKLTITDPVLLRGIIDRWDLLPINSPNFLEIDNSTISAKECASAILGHIESL